MNEASGGLSTWYYRFGGRERCGCRGRGMPVFVAGTRDAVSEEEFMAGSRDRRGRGAGRGMVNVTAG